LNVTTPGHAIQLQKGKYAGRLLFVGNHTVGADTTYYCHSFYTDDHGKTWKLGGDVDFEGATENQAIELSDGKIMMNTRISSSKDIKARMVAYSNDGGATWGKGTVDNNLKDPVCQGSILRYSSDPNYILFTNNNSETSRENMTIRISTDEGKTWKYSRIIQKNVSGGYSDMVVQSDNKIGILHEYGDDPDYKSDFYHNPAFAGIAYVTVDTDWIMAGDK
jgi:sialidase-1